MLKLNKIPGFEFDRDSGILAVGPNCSLIWVWHDLAAQQFLQYLSTETLSRLNIHIDTLSHCDIASREMLFRVIKTFATRRKRSIVLKSDSRNALQKSIADTALLLHSELHLEFVK